MDNHILQEAVRTYSTPCYIFDLDVFISRIRRMEQILGKRVNVYYAMKANPFLTAAAVQATDGLEVCSPGECAICRRARVPAQKIVLSGVSKEESHIRSAMAEQGAETYIVESLGQLRLLEACADATGRTGARVLLRLTNGNQFGMDEEDILISVRNRDSYLHLGPAGLQYCSGAQEKGMGEIEKELVKLDSFMDFVREHLDFEFRELEYGSGFQTPYLEGQKQADEETLLREFEKALDPLNFKGIIFLKAGRFLATPCGSYLVRVTDVRRNQGQNHYIVDGGINHINCYGQIIAMKVPAYRCISQGSPARPPALQTSSDRWTIYGSLCALGDILVKNLPPDGLMTGDLLVSNRISAYPVTKGTYLFLSRKLPVILTCTQEHGLSLMRDVLPTDILNGGSAMKICQPRSNS